MIRYFRRISDERHRRALKRRRTEEVMGWICVPVILVVGWYGWRGWEQLMTDRQAQFRDSATPAAVGAPPLRP